MTGFIKGDRVTASATAIESGLWSKRPAGRQGAVTRVTRAGMIHVLWDGNTGDDGSIHPDYLTLVQRPQGRTRTSGQRAFIEAHDAARAEGKSGDEAHAAGVAAQVEFEAKGH